MDPKPSHDLSLAPGGSDVRAARLPPYEPFPSLDDHLVEPETHQEIIRGRRVNTMAALPPHADRHCEIDYVLRGNVAAGYIASTELLTHTSIGSDFATDTCIRKEGKDPATGTRYLEELAFEVVNEQSTRDIQEKAEDLTTRGVRRVFAIFVKVGKVCSWENRRWRELSLAGVIQDRCFSRPVLVRALLDAGEADNAVAQALVDKQNPIIEAVRAKGEAKGEAKGRVEGRVEGEANGEAKGTALSVLKVLAARGLDVPDDVRARILECRDAPLLYKWIVKAVLAATAEDVVEDA